jgi:predicted nucleic-acid-binding protein
MAVRATALLTRAADRTLLLSDVVFAEIVYVMESFYEVARPELAEYMRAVIAHRAILTLDPSSLMRAVELYEVLRLDFAEAHVAAQAEATGVAAVISWDKTIDRVGTVRRIEP